MTLSDGATLGPYRIVAFLKRGGMGEVYQARDTRLNRDVAIKVLQAGVADNPSRRARFAREAQALSQLNHPHICATYDVGEANDLAYLVLEFIEGGTLEDRLRTGPLPWDTALDWAIQMAAAIDAAHARGIIHRDLKPSNVMIAASGIKLLDFGLAKLIDQPESGEGDVVTASLSSEHKMLGTPHYMAPEQIEGRTVDGRADIFAFGVTLYQMLTGRRAFDGTSVASVAAAILTVHPPSVSLTPTVTANVPREVDHILERALAKDPNERWQTARDLLVELEWLRDGRGRARTAPTGRRKLVRRLAMVGAAVTLAGLAAAIGWRSGRESAAPAIRKHAEFFIYPPPGTRFTGGYGRIAVSPDGRKVAFVAGPEKGPRLLWWQSLDSPTPRVLAATEEANGPFWSPDSTSIAFYSGKHLQRVSIDGGGPRVVTDLASPGMRGASESPSGFWSPDGTITFSMEGRLYRVQANGGGKAELLVDSGSLPRPLPGGRFLYVLPRTTSVGSSVAVAGTGLSAPVTLEVESNAVFAAGHLVFRKGQALVARPFDPRSATFTGPPVLLADSVATNPGGYRRSLFDASDDLLIYRSEPPRKLTWRSRDGTFLGSIGEVSRDWNPTVSRDGSMRVAVDRLDLLANAMHLWIIDSGGTSRQITFGAAERFPHWSPDGQSLAYLARGLKGSEIRRAYIGGTGADDVFVTGEGRLVPTDYGRNYLLYETGTPTEIYALPLANGAPVTGAEPVQLSHTPTITEGNARLSPDGRWVAFMSNDGVEQAVWVQAFPNGPKRRISSGAFDPDWRKDGGELYYVTPESALMAVPADVKTGTLGAPVELFKFLPGPFQTSLHVYAASPDGQRFLVSELTGPAEVITVVVNWASRLK